MDLITSSEMIKPLSHPTLPIQQPLKLSLVDQFCPISYTPLLLFYHPKDDLDHQTISTHLKQSLSRVLVPFRPLAGRVRHHSHIDCSDDGVPFSEGNIDHCSMLDFLEKLTLDKEMRALNQLVPCTPLVMQPDSSVPQVAARVTHFLGGGVALGVSSLHTTMDAVAVHNFVRSWAETMRGRFDRLAPPNFTAGPTLYPQPASPPEPPLLDVHTLSGLLGNLVFNDGSVSTATRVFVFKNQEIEKLKVSAGSEEVPSPTRYEALSGFIWKHIMEASRTLSGSAATKPSVAAHAVDMRRRLDPPLDGRFMGNFQNVAIVTCMDGGDELPELVRRTNESIKEKNARAFKEMEGDKCYEAMSGMASKALGEIGSVDLGDIDFVFFSSWCNMGFYQVDFGWGKPRWVGVCGEGEAHSGVGNFVFFVETSCGDGIQVTMMLEEKKMILLENDKNFLKVCYSHSRD